MLVLVVVCGLECVVVCGSCVFVGYIVSVVGLVALSCGYVFVFCVGVVVELVWWLYR